VRYDGDRVVKQLGKRIAAFRDAAGISQGGLAERIRSTPQWVSQLERGTRSPTVHTLVKLANALDVSLGELLDGTAKR
jgi:transcriptional regulator with XRE-family HTH domain